MDFPRRFGIAPAFTPSERRARRPIGQCGASPTLARREVRARAVGARHRRRRRASDGAKRVLGLREGSAENAIVAKGLLADLVERGLSVEKPCVCVIDGSKGIREAIADLFGKLGIVHRCHVHKTRNVLGHLPESMHVSVKRAMRQRTSPPIPSSPVANSSGSRAPSSESTQARQAPSARGSRRRSRSSDSASPVRCIARCGARTRSRISTVRSCSFATTFVGGRTERCSWIGSSLYEAQRGFRRVKGFREMKQLVGALEPSKRTRRSGIEEEGRLKPRLRHRTFKAWLSGSHPKPQLAGPSSHPDHNR
jgi:hypothetical protein